MKSVLVDTSIWVDHFRQPDSDLIRLLELDLAMTHQMVLAELACGTPPAPRSKTLGDIGLLRQAHPVSMAELMAFIERQQLYGLGCGLVDLALLASTLVTPGTELWTRDKRLAASARRLGVMFSA